jgi:hypothetical protein
MKEESKSSATEWFDLEKFDPADFGRSALVPWLPEVDTLLRASRVRVPQQR